MAQKCTDQYQSLVTISSFAPPSWWEPIIPYNCHYPSLNNMSSCDDDNDDDHHHQGEHFFNISTNNCFIDASDHSGLTGEDSSRRFVAGDDHSYRRQPRDQNELMDHEHVSDSQLWTHILLGGRNDIGEFGSNNQEVGDNLVAANLSRNNNSAPLISPEVVFEPVYDYLKKMDNDWEFSTSSSSSNKNSTTTTTTTFRDQVNGLTNAGSPQDYMGRSKRLTKLVSNWSTSPPPPPPDHSDPDEVNARLDRILPCNDDLDQFDPYNSSYGIGGKKNNDNNNNNIIIIPSLFPPLLYNHGQQLDDHVKMEREIEDSGSMFRRTFSFSDIKYDIGLNININNPVGEDYNCDKYYCGIPSTSSGARSLAGSVSLCKAPVDDIKAGARSSASQDCGKHGLQSSRQAGKWHGAQNNEGRKKRISEESSSTVLKKPKQESSIAAKIQAPKQKFAEKVTTLQQIVSPFGKTDTASVLLEAIQYIKCLQEQIQLLSNPYMKNLHKEHWPGSFETKEKGEHHAKLDLRSKGLSLVPISCIPQVLQDTAGSDYWTPPYRSCLYR